MTIAETIFLAAIVMALAISTVMAMDPSMTMTAVLDIAMAVAEAMVTGIEAAKAMNMAADVQAARCCFGDMDGTRRQIKHMCADLDVCQVLLFSNEAVGPSWNANLSCNIRALV